MKLRELPYYHHPMQMFVPLPRSFSSFCYSVEGEMKAIPRSGIARDAI